MSAAETTRDEHDQPPDVVGPEEAAAIIGVGKRRVVAIAIQHADTFPAARALRCGRVWDRAEVQAWANDRTGTQLAALRAYRRTGAIARAADVAGVSWPTARKWLRALRVL